VEVATRAQREGQELDQRAWNGYFEQLNRQLEEGTRLDATIELEVDPVSGTEAERLPLNSITYEDGDDEIAIGLGGRDERYPAVLWHFVENPQRVWVLEDEGPPTAIVIESEDEALTIVRLHPAG
jgi:hypothetical protein